MWDVQMFVWHGGLDNPSGDATVETGTGATLDGQRLLWRSSEHVFGNWGAMRHVLVGTVLVKFIWRHAMVGFEGAKGLLVSGIQDILREMAEILSQGGDAEKDEDDSRG